VRASDTYQDPKQQFSSVALDEKTLAKMWPENGFDAETLAGLKAHRNGAVVGSATMHRFGWKVGQNVILRSQIYPVTLPFVIVGNYSGGAPRGKLVVCNVEIESRYAILLECWEPRSNCRSPNLRNSMRERARGCCAPMMCAARG